jgi:hypothetical protein
MGVVSFPRETKRIEEDIIVYEQVQYLCLYCLPEWKEMFFFNLH